MPRKKQQLINYHTGSASNMPLSGDVQFGEIVVRHNAESPELLIKVSEGTNGTEGYKEYFVPFISSAKVSTEIHAAVVDAQGSLNSDISDLQNAISAVSATVTSDYALSAITQGVVDDAKTELIGSAEDDVTANTINAAKKYADAQDDALSGRIMTHVQTAITDTITGNVSTLQNKVNEITTGLSATVVSDYATKEFVGAASGYAYNTAKSDVIGTNEDNYLSNTVYGAKAYADKYIKALSGNVVDEIESKDTVLRNAVSTVDGKVDSLSGVVKTLSGDVVSYVDTKLSSVYDYKGSRDTYAELPTTADTPTLKNGDVYNVAAAKGNIGDADYVPAGTNYAWVADIEEAAGGHWDPLGGIVDLSGYATTGTTDGLNTRITALESASQTGSAGINAVSGALLTLSGNVVNNYSTTEEVDGKIAAASAASVTSAYTASTAYTDEKINELSGITSAYVASQISNVNESINKIATGYAVSAITHQEIEDAKSAVIGGDAVTSADTTTLKGLKLYSDQKDEELRGEINGLLDSFSGAMSGDFTSMQTQITNLSERITGNENKFTNSAATWNSALQHGELGTVSEESAGNGVTIQSGAKLKDDSTNKKLTLDLSELIIDCGEF